MSALVAPTLEESADLFPMFVYGTLRVGQGNFEWLGNGALYAVENAKVPGRIYWVDEYSGYPVGKLDEPGLIIGDILFFPKRDYGLHYIVGMETRSGYDLFPTEATDQAGNDWSVMAWHYRRTPRGELIASGDWVAAAATSYH